MIGFYNLSVVLTYIGLASSAFGISLACRGLLKTSLICLMVSGLCDMFDGTIARRIKRTEDEQRFGVQIDSLCDVICFGVFPAVICYNAGMRGLVGIFVMIMYILAAVIRLAFFNVQEEIRNQTTGGRRLYYQGLPVTSIALILPLMTILGVLISIPRPPVYTVTMMATAIAFVLNIPIKKPHFRGLMLVGLAGLILFILLLCIGKRLAS